MLKKLKQIRNFVERPFRHFERLVRAQLTKNIQTMRVWQFKLLPHRRWDEEIGEFDSLIILPTKHIHDSGYRALDFIATHYEKPICRLSGCSDVIHIEGIAGMGYKWLERYGRCPDKIKPRDWSIDCLAKSGLLRLFAHHKMVCGAALSSFEIYSVDKENTVAP